MLPTVVRRNDRDLLGRGTLKAHVHVSMREVLGLAEVLVKVRVRAELPLALVDLDVEQLVLARGARVDRLELTLKTATALQRGTDWTHGE